MSSTGSSADGSDVGFVLDDNLLPGSNSFDGSGWYVGSGSESNSGSGSTAESESFSGSNSNSNSDNLEFESASESDSFAGFDSDSGYLEYESTDESGSFLGSNSNSGYYKCTDISVGGDATYCIEGVICSGDGSKPTGYNCPQKHDVAVADCLENMRSFLDGDCVAPRDSVCHKTKKTGIWSCAWGDEVSSTNEEDASATTDSTATKVPTVEKCTGVGSGEKPVGASCPGSGDVAVGDCHGTLPSYSSGKCVAPSDSVCQKLETGTWGCVWSSNKGDNGASYAIDTSDVSSTATGGGSSAALIGGIVAAVVVAGVIAGVAVAWSRQNRQGQRRRSDLRMDAVLTPQSSTRNVSFQRV